MCDSVVDLIQDVDCIFTFLNRLCQVFVCSCQACQPRPPLQNGVPNADAAPAAAPQAAPVEIQQGEIEVVAANAQGFS